MHEGKNYQDFLKWEVVFRSFSYNNELKGFFYENLQLLLPYNQVQNGNYDLKFKSLSLAVCILSYMYHMHHMYLLK